MDEAQLPVWSACMVFDGETPIPHLPGLNGRRLGRAHPERFVSPQLQQLFNWWQGSAQERLPRYSDFDIVDHHLLAPNLFVAVHVESGFVLRLAGEEYQRMLGIKKGFEWRLDTPDLAGHDFAVYLAFILRQQAPYHSTGSMEMIDRGWLNFESLICPLADADGTISTLMGVVATLPN
jgi:hypothetical protein